MNTYYITSFALYIFCIYEFQKSQNHLGLNKFKVYLPFKDIWFYDNTPLNWIKFLDDHRFGINIYQYRWMMCTCNAIEFGIKFFKNFKMFKIIYFFKEITFFFLQIILRSKNDFHEFMINVQLINGINNNFAGAEKQTINRK